MIRPVSFPSFLKQIGLTQLSLDDKLSLPQIQESTGLDITALEEYEKIWLKTPQTALNRISDDCVAKLPEREARRFTAILYEETDEAYHIATNNTLQDALESVMSMRLDKEVLLHLADQAVITDLIPRIYRKTNQIVLLSKILVGEQVDFSSIKEPSIRLLVDMIINEAVSLGATDVHFEQNKHAFEYHYRVGHDVYKRVNLAERIGSPLLQRIILDAGGDITEKHLPQDLKAVYTYAESGSSVDCRISVLYTPSGFSCVLRLQYQQKESMSIHKIFTDSYSHDLAMRFLQQRGGLCLVTGPTSSGKTTLLYSMLNYLSQHDKKILTIEDPIEMELPSLIQVQIDEGRDLGFSEVIRSSLRQNPDVLMVGEIRDLVTCEMTIRAALTGALCFSTLHTESAEKTLARLFDLGIDMFNLAESLRLIYAVRLLPLICQYCRYEDPGQTNKNKVQGLFPNKDLSHIKSYSGKGCTYCEGKGLKGQVMISECLVIESDLRLLLEQGKMAEATGLANTLLSGRTLLDNALSLWEKGMVTADDIYAVRKGL